MPGESKTTKDHDTIIQWALKRDGKPAIVEGTKGNGKGAGMLRINFPQYSGNTSLKEISWDEFFATFDNKGLSFLYQETTAGGDQSRFFKFIASQGRKGGEKKMANNQNDKNKRGRSSGGSKNKNESMRSGGTKGGRSSRNRGGNMDIGSDLGWGDENR